MALTDETLRNMLVAASSSVQWSVAEANRKEAEWRSLDPNWATNWPADRCRNVLMVASGARTEIQATARMYLKYWEAVEFHLNNPPSGNNESFGRKRRRKDIGRRLATMAALPVHKKRKLGLSEMPDLEPDDSQRQMGIFMEDISQNDGNCSSTTTSMDTDDSVNCDQKQNQEQMQRIRHLEAVVQSKEKELVGIRNQFHKAQGKLQSLQNELDSGKLRRLNTKELVAIEKYETLKQDNDGLRGEIERLQGNPCRLGGMDADGLRQLKTELHRSIMRVEEAEDQLAAQSKCVVCADKRKDVIFDGCEHMSVCSQCVSDLNPKQCPVCRAPFVISRVIKM